MFDSVKRKIARIGLITLYVLALLASLWLLAGEGSPALDWLSIVLVWVGLFYPFIAILKN